MAPILKRPQALAVDTDGSLLIANQGTDQILRWTERGGLSLLAGKGTPGYAGDGGLATKAELNQPSGMAVAPDGTIYVADTANNALRMISPRGVISTLARVKNPQAVALSPDGALYVVDSQGVDEVSPTGSLTLVLPSGPGRYVINGTATAFIPWAIAIDGDGDIYVGNLSPKLLMEFSAQGQLLQSWTLYVTPAGLATAPDGSLLIGDYGWFRVDRLAQGQLTPVAELEAGAFPKLGGFRPSGVAVGTDGTIYADDDGANGLGDTSLLSLSPGGATKVLIAISPPTVVSP